MVRRDHHSSTRSTWWLHNFTNRNHFLFRIIFINITTWTMNDSSLTSHHDYDLDIIKSWWSRLYSGLIDRMYLGYISDASRIYHQIKCINVNALTITLNKRFLPIYVMCLLLNGSVQMIIMWCWSCHVLRVRVMIISCVVSVWFSSHVHL